MSNFQTKRLGDVVESIIDNRGRNPKSYQDQGIPVIDNYLITSDGEARLSEVKRFIDDETYESFLRKYIKPGDVLMTLVGNGYGKVSITPKEKCAIIQNTIGLRCDENNDNQYLYYLLRSNRNALMALNRGAAQPSIKVGDILDLEFPFPSLTEQKAVSGILKSMDAKIELNRQANQTLENITQAIFKSWFVDFDPTRAKIAAKENGQNPELAAMAAIAGKEVDELDALSVEQLEKLKSTAALFPDSFEDSELGKIPEGWAVKALDEIAHYQNGLALQKFRPEDESNYLPVLKIAQLKKGFADGAEKASPNIKEECIVNDGDVVFSWSGSLMIDVWCGGKAALNQHLFKVTSEQYPKWFYYYWTKQHLESFQQIAADKAVTMGHIKRSHLAEAKCAVPNVDMNSFQQISLLLDKIVEQRLESTTLEQVRDALLPKLLSGELEVGSAN